MVNFFDKNWLLGSVSIPGRQLVCQGNLGAKMLCLFYGLRVSVTGIVRVTDEGDLY